MRKIAALTAVSVLALYASPASAQAFSGPRVEILGGWDQIKVDIDADDFDTPPPEGHLSDEALVYGIGAGYDFAVGPAFSVGADVELTKSQVDVAVTDELFVENGPDTTTANDDELIRTRFRSKGGRDLYVGGRATFNVSNNIAFYLKAGYSWFRTKNYVYQTTFDPPGSASADLDLLATDNETLGGWRVGAGAHFTNGMFYAGPEYRYSNYGDGVKRHQLVAVAGIKFGRPAEVLPPPPVVEAPPPPPPPPATQTCPDGSVILATEVCPAPPPPPPPPPPAPERG